MNVLYLDCASGLSGEMLLGALADAGVDLPTIQAGIDSLGWPAGRLELSEVKRPSLRAVRLRVQATVPPAARNLPQFLEQLAGSQLSSRQREWARRIAQRLADAEAHVRGVAVSEVNLAEAGPTDRIAEIVGAAIGLDLLHPQRIVCSPVPVGQGTVSTGYGRCHLPTPTTAEILRGVPLAVVPVEAELTTPAAAAIVAVVADEFGPLPAITIERIGYGSGADTLAEPAQILRLILGRSTDFAGLTDQITVLETNLDDVTGEVLGYCLQQLMAAGALDAYATGIYMKKNRPATKLTVLCENRQADALETLLFQETHTLGVRRWLAARRKLHRLAESVASPWGPVAGHRVTLPDGSRLFFPEYEDCRRLAERHRIPLQSVLDGARRAGDNAT